MNWDAIGAAAELLGASGVIASLVYLAVQIRQNSHTVRSSIIDSVTSRSADHSRYIVSDRRISRLARKGFDEPDALDADELNEFFLLVMGAMRDSENIYYQYRQGLLPDEVYHSARSVATIWVQSPLFPRWWAQRKHVFHPSFRAFVEELMPGERRFLPLDLQSKV
jgi:hypothetical protein